MFAILDCISDIIKKSLLPERKLGGYVLSGRNHYPGLFLCRNHKHMSNVNSNYKYLFQQRAKETLGHVRKDNIKAFKLRQTKRAIYHNPVVKPF